MLDQAAVPWFVELNRSLGDTLDDAALRERIAQGADRLLALAAQLLARADSESEGLEARDLRAALAARRAAASYPSMLFAPLRERAPA